MRRQGLVAEGIEHGARYGPAREGTQQVPLIDEATPRDVKVFHLRGRVLDRLGRPDEARAMYQRSRELQDL